MDLEDIGSSMKKAKENSTNKSEVKREPKEMVTAALRKSLTKQGYKIIGSHSGVKICRWTKAMMRGKQTLKKSLSLSRANSLELKQTSIMMLYVQQSMKQT